MESSKNRQGEEGQPTVSGGETRDPEPVVDASGNAASPDQTQETSEDQANPEVVTPEQEAARGYEERIKELLGAYQETLDTIEELPTVVWVPWDSKKPGSYFKVPYLRWFLNYFVVHHIDRTLNLLNRRFHAIAAVSDDPDANRMHRETVKLYLQSLPRLPYRLLIFVAIAAALVLTLPLRGFGNVFYVLDIVGAFVRSDVGYVGRALEGNQLGLTVRSIIVLTIGLLAVAAVTTSPFGLKRIVFNLYPWTNERINSTAARRHGLRAEGLYALEDSVFAEVGVRRPHEWRWDLAFQTFLLSVLFVFWLCLAALTMVIAMSWNIKINLDTRSPGEVHFFLPRVSWVYYALFTGFVLALFVLLLMRLVAAWRTRGRNTIG